MLRRDEHRETRCGRVDGRGKSESRNESTESHRVRGGVLEYAGHGLEAEPGRGDSAEEDGDG